MKKLDSKGFSFVEVLLVLMVISLVGGVGWYIWRQRITPISNTQKEKVADKLESNTHPEPEETGITSDIPGTYNHENPNFTFIYNKGWELTRAVTHTNTEYETEYIYVSSADFKELETDKTIDYCTYYQGMKFSVAISKDNSAENIVDEILKENSMFLKNPEEMTVNGMKALQYLGTPGECGYSLRTIFEAESKIYEISTLLNISNAEDLGPYLLDYNNLVASFKVK